MPGQPKEFARIHYLPKRDHAAQDARCSLAYKEEAESIHSQSERQTEKINYLIRKIKTLRFRPKYAEHRAWGI